MRPLLVALAALSICAPSAASAQADRLRALSDDMGQVRADAGQTYRRLMLLQNELLGDGLGARVTITQESSVDPFYRLAHASYSLDGRSLLARSGADVSEPFMIHDGVVGPGDHVLSVVLRYVGDGHGVIGYLPGYRFVMRSSFQFTVPPEGQVELRVRPYTHGPMVPYTERLAIEYDSRTLDE